MKEVLARTKPKDSFTLVASDNSADIQTTFNPPLYLQANRNYELAMVNLETYSFANILGDNNSFKWSADDCKTWTILHVPTGCCELKAINADMIRIRGVEIVTLQFFQMSTRCNAYCLWLGQSVKLVLMYQIP